MKLQPHQADIVMDAVNQILASGIGTGHQFATCKQKTRIDASEPSFGVTMPPQAIGNNSDYKRFVAAINRKGITEDALLESGVIFYEGGKPHINIEEIWAIGKTMKSGGRKPGSET